MRRGLALLLWLVALLALAGCAAPAVEEQSGETAGEQAVGCPGWPDCDSDRTAAPHSDPLPPTSVPAAGACPALPHEQLPPGCVPYDPGAAMRANEGYRQRSELPAEQRPEADRRVQEIRSLLGDAASSGTLTPEEARDVLGAAGYTQVQTAGSDSGSGLAVGVGIDGGCVFGTVNGDSADLEASGYIADGGCLPARGH